MGYTKVKGYSDAQLIARAKEINGFKSIPKGYWLMIIKSNENTPNVFDDKAYFMKGEKCLIVTTCTANTGSYGLLNWRKWSKLGAAIIKFNEWYYDAFQYGLHKGKMRALRQVVPFKYYRDSDMDLLAEEQGKVYTEIAYTNFHCNDYNQKKGIKTWIIGGWSVGCIVCNNFDDYYKIIDLVQASKEKVSACFAHEF